MADERRVHRIVIDVLATEDQTRALEDLLGEAVCGAPVDHPGPCRIAWSITSTFWSDDPEDASYGLDAEAEQEVRRHLEPVEVWPAEDVDRSLGLI